MVRLLNKCKGHTLSVFPIPLLPMDAAARAAEAISLDEQLLAIYRAH